MLVASAAGAAAGAALLAAPRLAAAWKFNSSDWTTVAVSMTPASQAPGPDGTTKFVPDAGGHPTVSIIGGWRSLAHHACACSMHPSCHTCEVVWHTRAGLCKNTSVMRHAGAISAVFMVVALFLLVLLAWLDGRRRRRALERQRRDGGGSAYASCSSASSKYFPVDM